MTADREVAAKVVVGEEHSVEPRSARIVALDPEIAAGIGADDGVGVQVNGPPATGESADGVRAVRAHGYHQPANEYDEERAEQE